MAKIRVLLADDHPVVRKGIRTVLERAPMIELVGEAENGIQLLPMLDQLKPDIVLLDIEMPHMSGLEVARALRAHRYPVRVLALSGHSNFVYVRSLLSSGVAGYLTKEEAPELLVEAIQRVAAGEQGWFSQRVTAHVSGWLRANAENRHISDREFEVLQLIAEGKTNQEIGNELHISVKTVEKHVRALFDKVGLNSRVELALWATYGRRGAESVNAKELS
jgi:DNA-binding NarL/FixJ family response regulator